MNELEALRGHVDRFDEVQLDLCRRLGHGVPEGEACPDCLGRGLTPLAAFDDDGPLLGPCEACGGSGIADQTAAGSGQMNRELEVSLALKGLVDRLDEIHADPAYESVWTVHQIHMGRYRGPTYIDALARARAALKR
jgi:hypothetical protein